jgi:serine/threonine protein kinase
MVKVLDFGLANLADASNHSDAGGHAQLSLSPTITSPAPMTGAGVILGTAAYMAPEQAKGRSVDRRADVWAFGAVLFEMLTGRRCFQGDEVSDTLAAILRAAPDWTALPRELKSKPLPGLQPNLSDGGSISSTVRRSRSLGESSHRTGRSSTRDRPTDTTATMQVMELASIPASSDGDPLRAASRGTTGRPRPAG